jgi:uncharacterized protein (DUF427 family)
MMCSRSRGTRTSRRTRIAKCTFGRAAARSVCPWKGIASYYDIVADDSVDAQAAWSYPIPWARRIKRRGAFWGGVRVELVDERV